MSRQNQHLVGLLAALCLMTIVQAIDFKNPVRSAAEDEVTALPGLSFKPNFKHYSGYLEADSQQPTNRFWHYWFVESQSDPSKDPLVLWLNGGPGCSSLLGLLTELGPFAVNSDGQVVENPFAWNKKANIIFMESPAGVGFSYAVDGSIEADDDSTSEQNHLALKSFLRKFPQYKDRPLYLTGESYGGVYLPTLGVRVDQDPEMNLKGIAIGNGYLDANKLSESLVYFSYYHGLIGRSIWKGLSTYCCDGNPPARGVCKFTNSRRSEKCSDYVTKATDAILNSGLNPYNLYDKCANSADHQLKRPSHKYLSREHFDRSLLSHSFNVSRPKFLSAYTKVRPTELELSLGNDPPCTDDAVTIHYLNRQEVKAALHIPEALTEPFTTCFDGIKYTMIYPASKNGLAPQMKHLIDSSRNLTLLVYNGDTDMMCNFFGDEWFVDDLGRPVIDDYRPWHHEDQVAGFVKHFDKITFMTIKGSGHMVPTDRPAEALQMFNAFLYGHKHD